MSIWNPWHGCTRLSRACAGCIVFQNDAAYGRNTSLVRKTRAFDLPLKKNRRGEYRVSSKEGIVETCCTSDFFHPDADAWRREAWGMMKERADLTFFIITKRPERFYVSLPDDWGAGYENVIIGCSCESQYTADRRLPVLLGLPVRHKKIVQEQVLRCIVEYQRKHGFSPSIRDLCEMMGVKSTSTVLSFFLNELAIGKTAAYKYMSGEWKPDRHP